MNDEELLNFINIHGFDLKTIKKFFPEFKKQKNKEIEKKFYDLIHKKTFICDLSKKEKIFINFKKGYSSFCDKNTKICICYKDFLSKHSRKNFGHDDIKKKDIIRKKINETMLKKHGVINPSHNKSIVMKRKQTNIEKYGISCNLQLKEIREKAIKSNIEKYGKIYPLQNEEIRKKAFESFVKKYNVENPFFVDDIRRKFETTMIERYGVDNFSKIGLLEVKDKIFNKNWLYDEYVVKKKTGEQIAKDLGLSKSFVCKILKKNFKIRKTNKTFPESEIECFLKEHFKFNVDRNKRKLIYPYEIDIFIPEKNIAIEYCGLFWHSERQKQKEYHRKKLEKCIQKKLKLITLFSNEWMHDRERTQQKLIWILEGNEYKIYEEEIGKEEILVDRRWTEGTFLLDFGYELIETLPEKRWGIDDKNENIYEINDDIEFKNFIWDCGWHRYKKL
ncbi:MAG: hypothetical protein NZZ41_05550 [Candidatus Dojkabacteria bacterium]|nr:hypothetical protein [Candidatus Dojkabacteria bacterium]